MSPAGRNRAIQKAIFRPFDADARKLARVARGRTQVRSRSPRGDADAVDAQRGGKEEPVLSDSEIGR